MADKDEFVVCECHSDEHLLRLISFHDDDLDLGYIHVHLAPRPFWERLRIAVRYIFGYQSKYGAFDEFIIGPNNINKFKDFFDSLDQGVKEAQHIPSTRRTLPCLFEQLRTKLSQIFPRKKRPPSQASYYSTTRILTDLKQRLSSQSAQDDDAEDKWWRQLLK